MPWLVQLALISIALPLVTMSAMAAVAGAVWLKHRAPIRDRRRSGSARLAVPASCRSEPRSLIISAIVQITLPSGVALAIVAVLAVLALLWLRQVIHVGLLEEAL